MKKALLFTGLIMFLISSAGAQAPGILWSQTFGGHNNDEAYDVKRTTDGGFIVCGMTESKGQGGKDAWVLKLDANGRLEWDKTYGEKGDEEARAIIQTRDGGYAFIGYTTSKNRRGRQDVWLVKLDSSGKQIWEGVYGGRKHDYGNDLVQTIDGDYALLGTTRSYGAGGTSLWIIKVDTLGKRIWRRTEGGKKNDAGASITEDLRDSSLVVSGSTMSFGNGPSSFWLVKISQERRRVWRKDYGHDSRDVALDHVIKSTGEYVLAGYSQPRGERYRNLRVAGFTPESWDDWDMVYGTVKDETATGIAETTDGGVVVCGHTNSIGEGHYDIWMMKFDNTGKRLWQETYGDINEEMAHAVIALGANEVVVVGSTMSDGAGKRDVWVLYLK
jgi:predicted secreted protein